VICLSPAEAKEDVYVKSIRVNRETIVAVCDAELLGKTLLGGRAPFEVSERFYKGIPVELDEAIEHVKRATIVNLVGRRTVDAAILAGLVHPKAVLYFGDVPHAQIVQL